jgi:hypothetical protein
MASKLVTLSADETTATVADATMGDIVSTLISSNSAVTGVYSYIQKAGVFVAGMAVQNNRLGRGLNPFGG